MQKLFVALFWSVVLASQGCADKMTCEENGDALLNCIDEFCKDYPNHYGCDCWDEHGTIPMFSFVFSNERECECDPGFDFIGEHVEWCEENEEKRTDFDCHELREMMLNVYDDC